MIRDFLRAMSACLKENVGEECALYYGQVLQGARLPCVVLLPPRVSRRVLSGGRVQREYAIDLRFYPEKGAGILPQQEMGERLICSMDELMGEERNYRGRDMCYEAGEQYLTIAVKYDVITLKSLERGEDEGIDEDTMLEFGFELGWGEQGVDEFE